MEEIEIELKNVLKLLFPQEIFEYFDIVSIDTKEKEIHIYLDEKNQLPEDYKKEKLLSKGFHNPSIIQDFPIRNKATFLHIRRRRWKIKSTGLIISRDWNTVAKGTHLTKDFATFLKGIFGQLPNK